MKGGVKDAADEELMALVQRSWRVVAWALEQDATAVMMRTMLKRRVENVRILWIVCFKTHRERE